MPLVYLGIFSCTTNGLIVVLCIRVPPTDLMGGQGLLVTHCDVSCLLLPFHIELLYGGYWREGGLSLSGFTGSFHIALTLILDINMKK